MRLSKARSLVVVAVAGVVAMTLAACGSAADDPTAQNPTTESTTQQSSSAAETGGTAAASAESSAAETSAAETSESAAPAENPKGDLTVYTSQPDGDIAEMVTAFNKKYPDVTVNVFRSGTEEVLSKIRAEKQAGAVQADVVFIADALSMEALKSESLLAPYTSPEAAGIDPQYIDPDGYYAGTKVIATGIAINTTAVTTKPTSWSVLTSPEAKGKAEMPSPLYSGAAAYNVSVLAADPAFGWDFWQGVADNGMTVTKGNGAVLKDVASGDKSYGMVVDFIVARAAAEGSPVEFVYPDEGVMAITEPIGLSADAHNPVAAKAFIDFVLSEAGQEVESGLGYVPIRAEAPVPNGLKGVADLKLIAGDLDQLSKSTEADKTKFADMFHQ